MDIIDDDDNNYNNVDDNDVNNDDEDGSNHRNLRCSICRGVAGEDSTLQGLNH